jgi:sensor histidine kinase YesM
VYDNAGNLLTSSDNRQPWTADEVRNHDWFRETVRQDGRVHFDGPIPEPGAFRDAAYASSIVIRDFSNPTEFIVVRVEYSDVLFRSMSRTSNISDKSRLIILNGDHEPVYASRPGPDPAADRELLAGLPPEAGSYWAGEGDEAWLVSHSRSDYSGWHTVLMTPRSEIIGPLEQIKTATLLTALAAFGVTAVVSLLFGRRITQPILSLYRSVSRVKRGDFSERAVVHRSDEIGRIAMKFNEMQDELQNLIETKYIYQIKLREAELSMLYAQINPHFLYNTLDIIKAQADYYRVGQIGDMAQSLADMFRYNLKSGGDGVVTLGDELEQIRSYMNIQRIRFEERLSFDLDIEEGLHEYPLIKMTLQPLVENAVFHGIERSVGKGVIRVSARREGERVRIAVSDDGAGMAPGRLEMLREMLRRPLYPDGIQPGAGQFGIGLHNVYARYKIRLGARFDMEIDSIPDRGTTVSLLLTWDD